MFDDDAMADWLTRLDAVRELLTTGGRTTGPLPEATRDEIDRLMADSPERL